MKYSWRLTALLLGMFFITQLIGLAVIHAYSPEIKQVTNENGELVNVTVYNLPYGTNPPEGITPQSSLVSIVIAIIFAVVLMLILMKLQIELILKTWFFIVVALALGITINAPLQNLSNSSYIALGIGLIFAFFKVIKRNLLVHNLTELVIYPGIAAIFVPLLNIWSVVLLLVLISIYDIYAVWHVGFMQKMAKYQTEKLGVLAGFFVPYMGKKEKEKLAKIRASNPKNLRSAKVKVNVAILGGGDVVFPIILAGVVLGTLGLIPALIITVGATIALSILFYYSEKGKFYPAMPFISAGWFVALGIAYLI